MNKKNIFCTNTCLHYKIEIFEYSMLSFTPIWNHYSTIFSSIRGPGLNVYPNSTPPPPLALIVTCIHVFKPAAYLTWHNLNYLFEIIEQNRTETFLYYTEKERHIFYDFCFETYTSPVNQGISGKILLNQFPILVY